MRTLSLIIALLLLFVACKKDKDEEEKPVTLNKAEMTLNHDGNDQLTLSRIVDCTWDTDDDYIASISSTGLVTGNTIGETKVHARLTSGQVLDCFVKVDPRSLMYKEPAFQAGASKTWVKSHETREIFDEDGDFIVYLGENNKVGLIMYMFANNELESVIVLLETSDSNFDEAVTFLEERYMFVEELYDIPDTEVLLVYENNLNTMLGLSIHSSLGLNVLYMEDSYKKAELIEKVTLKYKALKDKG